jgi:hypothetical protein
MQRLGKLDDRYAFFNDQRGPIISRVWMDKGTPFNSDSIDAHKDDVGWQILFAKNYEDSIVGNIGDKDIPAELTDFLVKTALWHREIDRPTSMSPGLVDAKESVGFYAKIMAGRVDGDKLTTKRFGTTDVNLKIDAAGTISEAIAKSGAHATDNLETNRGDGLKDIGDNQWYSFIKTEDTHYGTDDWEATVTAGTNNIILVPGDEWGVVQTGTASKAGTATSRRPEQSIKMGVADTKYTQFQVLMAAMLGLANLTAFGADLKSAKGTSKDLYDGIMGLTTSGHAGGEPALLSGGAGFTIKQAINKFISGQAADAAPDATWDDVHNYNTTTKKGLIHAIMRSAGVATRNATTAIDNAPLIDGVTGRGLLNGIAGNFFNGDGGKVQNSYLLTKDLISLITKFEATDGKTNKEYRKAICADLVIFIREFIEKMTLSLFEKLYTGTIDTQKHVHDDAQALLEGEVKGRWMDSWGNSFASEIKNRITKKIKELRPADATFKTLADDIPWKLYQDIRKEFADQEYKPDAVEFYKRTVQLLKLNAGKWAPAGDIWNVEIPVSQKANYRINILKNPIDSDTTVFEASIPYLASPSVDNIHYTDWENNKKNVAASTMLEGKLRTLLRRIYRTIYIDAGTGNSIDFDGFKFYSTWAKAGNYLNSTHKFFSFQYDKLIQARLAKIIAQSDPSTETPEEGEEVYDFITDASWTFQDGKLMKKNDAGKWIEYGITTDIAKKILTKDSHCYSTYVYGDKPEKCFKFIFDCILSDDKDSGKLGSCIAEIEMGGQSFVEQAESEISKMHISIAYRILQRFNFKRYKTTDSSGQSIYRMESVDSWITRYIIGILKMDDAKVERFFKGEKRYVMKYFSLLVAYINSNPGVLNKNYAGVDTAASVPEETDDYFAKLNIKPDYISKDPYSQNVLDRLRHKLTGSFFGATQTSAPDFNNMMPMGRFGMPGMMQQGGEGGVLPFGMAVAIAQDKPAFGSEFFAQHLNSLMSDLKNRNKTFTAADTKIIQDKIKKLKDSEEGLAKIMNYMIEFRDLFRMFGDRESKTLSVGNLKSMIDHYRSLRKYHQKTESGLFGMMENMYGMMTPFAGATAATEVSPGPPTLEALGKWGV